MFAVDINVVPSQDTVDTNDYAKIWDGRNDFLLHSKYFIILVITIFKSRQ